MTEMDFNRMVNMRSEDKSMQMTIGVYNGRPSAAFFNNDTNGGGGGGRGPAAKFNLNLRSLMGLSNRIRQLKSMAPDAKIPAISITIFNPETKKFDTLGSITLGRDNAGKPYIGITHKDLPKPKKFIIRSPDSLDFSEAMTAVENVSLDLDWFITMLDVQMPAAMLHTSYKQDRSGGGRGPSSGGGRGNYSGGGGGSRPNSGGGGRTEIDDEITF